MEKKKKRRTTNSGYVPVPPELKKKRGRPRLSEIEKVKKVGRPPGEATAIKEYKARLLASPKSKRVLDVILNAALDDDHKNQAAAWKLVMDRLMPLSHFEKEKMANDKANINITISGIGSPEIDSIDGDVIDTNE